MKSRCCVWTPGGVRTGARWSGQSPDVTARTNARRSAASSDELTDGVLYQHGPRLLGVSTHFLDNQEPFPADYVRRPACQENGCDERSLTRCALPPARRRHRRVGALTAKAQPDLRGESAVDGPGPTGVVYALNAGLLWLWSRFGGE